MGKYGGVIITTDVEVITDIAELRNHNRFMDSFDVDKNPKKSHEEFQRINLLMDESDDDIEKRVKEKITNLHKKILCDLTEEETNYLNSRSVRIYGSKNSRYKKYQNPISIKNCESGRDNL